MGSDVFARPTSVLLCGEPGALLDWVAFGIAHIHPGGYFWTDVRLPGQVADERGPLGLGRIPADHLNVVQPQELAQNDAPANAAISGVVRADEPDENLRQVVDFLRLPLHTQRLISRLRTGVHPLLLVLSNGHRIAGSYPDRAVRPVLNAITGAGVSILITFPDEAPQGRLNFDNVWHVRGEGRPSWPRAQLVVEKATFGPPLETGARVSLRDLPGVATVVQSAP